MMIFVKEGKEDVFHQFEDFAIPILEDYNGKLIYRIRPTKESFVSFEDELPYEIHFLSFETEKDFLNLLLCDVIRGQTHTAGEYCAESGKVVPGTCLWYDFCQ